jgi:lysophospholipase L1-like esterase
MSVQVSYKKQFVLGIMLLLVLLVVIEGVIRTYEYFEPGCKYIGQEALNDIDLQIQKAICRDANNLIYSEVPILQFYPDQNLSTIHINSFGFRGDEITQNKPDNVYRIFVVGGSTTYGAASVSDKTTIPGYLQQMFDKENLEINVEIINAGIGSAYSFTESFYIKDKLLSFVPDLFIIYDGGNDAYDRHLNSSLNLSPNPIIESGKTLLKLSGYRTPFFVLGVVFYQAAEPAPINDEIKSQIVSLWKSRWSEICDLGQNENFSILLTVQPILGTGNKTLSLNEKELAPNDKFGFGTLEILEGIGSSLDELNQKCDATGDLRNTFDNIQEPIYYDYIHISDYGHQIIAERLFELSLPLVLEDIQEQ